MEKFTKSNFIGALTKSMEFSILFFFIVSTGCKVMLYPKTYAQNSATATASSVALSRSSAEQNTTA